MTRSEAYIYTCNEIIQTERQFNYSYSSLFSFIIHHECVGLILFSITQHHQSLILSLSYILLLDSGFPNSQTQITGANVSGLANNHITDKPSPGSNCAKLNVSFSLRTLFYSDPNILQTEFFEHAGMLFHFLKVLCTADSSV